MAGQLVPGDGVVDGPLQRLAAAAVEGAGYQERQALLGREALQTGAAGAEAGVHSGGHQQLGWRVGEGAAQGSLPIVQAFDHLIAGGIERLPSPGRRTLTRVGILKVAAPVNGIVRSVASLKRSFADRPLTRLLYCTPQKK